MKHECWEAIHAVFEKLHALAPPDTAVATAADGGSPNGTTPAGSPALPPARALVEVRAAVRTELDRLRSVLQNHFTEHDAYLILFPIVIHLDEYVQVNLMASNHPKAAYFARLMKWPTLQKELFDVEDGGILFFDALDDLLRKPQTPTFVFEAYFLCLKHGFQGRHAGNPEKLVEYQRKLTERIPVPPTPTPPDQLASVPLEDPPSPLWYYALALIVIAVVYGVLGNVARAYVRASLPEMELLRQEPLTAETTERKLSPAHPTAGPMTATDEHELGTAGHGPGAVVPGSGAAVDETSSHWKQNHYVVQVGPLADDGEAARLRVLLREKGYAVTVVPESTESGVVLHSVRIGDPLPRERATRLLNSFVAAEGIRCVLRHAPLP